MPSEELPTFEFLRARIGGTPSAEHGAERRISWVGSQKLVAFARDPDGQLEIFLLGGRLHAASSAVRELMVYNSWETDDGSRLSANRLALPAGRHFDAIGATVLIELLESGYEVDPVQAFRHTEDLIALILDDATSENAALTGLAGELLLLASLLKSTVHPPEVILKSWQGWGRSSRDFQLGSIGVEVKTSTTGSSRHHVQGWYQVELGVPALGVVETGLYLLSIGIQWLPMESRGSTLEGLVQVILEEIPADRRIDFINTVRNYCGLGLSIDDHGIAQQAALQRPFVSTFERMYDLLDEKIRLPKSSDLALFSNVISDSVKFEIELPDIVRGDRNPLLGLNACATFLVDGMHQ